LLQRRQAATTFVQMSVPFWLKGRIWSRDSSRAGKRIPQYMQMYASCGTASGYSEAAHSRGAYCGIARMPDGRHDGIHLEYGAPPGAGIHAAVELVEQRSAGVCDLFLMIESRRLAVIDPLQRHSRDIGAQHELRQPARRGVATMRRSSI